MKLLVRKDVLEQVTSMLEKSRTGENKGNLGEFSAIPDDNSKLPASKNDFFDFEKSFRYIKRWYSNGEWHYLYPSKYRAKANRTETKNDIAKTTKLITGIKPLNNPTEKEIDEALLQLSLYAIDGKLKCKALGNHSVYITNRTQEHIKETHNEPRTIAEMKHKAKYIPFVPEILKNGKISEKSSSKEGVIYGVIGQVEYFDEKKNKVVNESVELAINFDKDTRKFVFSFADKGIKKSLFDYKDLNDHFSADPIVDTKTVPITIYRIAEYSKKSSNINKSLTYSGHKLQGRTSLYGMNISIENKKGSYRSGTDKDGHKWRTYMNYDYGYIRETVGVDGDHVDCYIGPDKTSNKVYVIHQNDPVTKKYDEDKCMLCFESADAAKKAYMKQYDRPGFFGSMDILTIEQFKSYVFSHLGKRIHKSFDIKVTDITENNKQQKIEQVEKALTAIYNNRPFIIKHISGNDGSIKYDDITLRIKNFDKDKIQKAVHSMAFTLDSKLKSAKGEAFNYKSQEQLTDKFVDLFSQKTNAVYQFVIDYFDLPEIRVVSKSKLRYKGKVLYNPETGKPIDKKDWNKFVKALEDFLNRNYDGMGEKIVLSSEALGRILEKLSKNQTLEQIKKTELQNLEYKGYKYEWISNSAKNMKDAFGETVSRDRAARIQVAMDSAAVKVKRVSDNMRNDIQDIIINGIKNKESKSKISQNLFDKCVGLNRDFQKIADSEIQNNTNVAYVKEAAYSAKEGEKVYFKRAEIIDDNTCKKCKKIKNIIALWSDTALPDEHINDVYADYAIWEGKETGDVPIGIFHPFCRGSWFRYYPQYDNL